MSTLTGDIETLLTTVSNVHLGNMPAAPDNIVCIYHTGGYARSSSGTQLEEPTFQVRVRNTNYATGFAVCNTVKDLLHNKTEGGIIYCEQQGDILDLGRDESNRPEFSINFRCYYRRN